MTVGQVFIGTSGWEYTEWACDFYREVKAQEHFSFRFHGLSGGSRHDYTPDELSPWSKHVKEEAAAGRRVFLILKMTLMCVLPGMPNCLWIYAAIPSRDLSRSDNQVEQRPEGFSDEKDLK